MRWKSSMFHNFSMKIFDVISFRSPRAREDVERLAARSSPLPDGWLRGNEPLWSPQGVHS